MNAFSPRHHTANNTNAEDVQPTVDEVEQLRKRGKPFRAEPVDEHHFLSLRDVSGVAQRLALVRGAFAPKQVQPLS
jgi:hypothetical protein